MVGATEVASHNGCWDWSIGDSNGVSGILRNKTSQYAKIILISKQLDDEP